MVALSIKSNIADVRKNLTRLQRKQLPFAVSVAMNKTIFDVRKHIVTRVYPRSFIVKNKSFARTAFRVEKSNKRDFNRGRMQAALFDRLHRSFLPRQITGGTKKPFRSSRLAIPVDVRRTASGKIGKRRQPRNIPNRFIADLKGRGPAIWSRTENGLILWYVLKPTARVVKAFPFFEESAKKTRQRYRRHLDVAITKALRTARPTRLR